MRQETSLCARTPTCAPTHQPVRQDARRCADVDSPTKNPAEGTGVRESGELPLLSVPSAARFSRAPHIASISPSWPAGHPQSMKRQRLTSLRGAGTSLYFQSSYVGDAGISVICGHIHGKSMFLTLAPLPVTSASGTCGILRLGVRKTKDSKDGFAPAEVTTSFDTCPPHVGVSW